MSDAGGRSGSDPAPIVRAPDEEESERRRLGRDVDSGRMLTDVAGSAAEGFGRHIGRRPAEGTPARLSRRRHFQLGGLLLAGIGVLTILASPSAILGPLLLVVCSAQIAAAVALVLVLPRPRTAALAVALVGAATLGAASRAPTGRAREAPAQP